MEEDIIEAIKEFEKHNEIQISNYYYRTEKFNSSLCKDGFIGSDIFENNIKEWLEICEDEQERHYFLLLLSHFSYFPENRYNFNMHKLIDNLKRRSIFMEKTIFVVSMSKNGTASGGDNVSAALKLATIGEVRKENIITNFERASDDLKRNFRQVSYIVFIDDIIGSGKTLYTNINNFMHRFNDDIGENTELIIASLCGREKKIKEKIRQLKKSYNRKFNYENLYPVQKSLDECKLLDESGKKRIEKIEKIIEKNAIYDDGRTYIMGFEKNQLLVGFYYNTPNNTLSLFWRPSKISVPLFGRTSYKRPDINECRENKRKVKENAYELGRMRNNGDSNSDNHSIVY